MYTVLYSDGSADFTKSENEPLSVRLSVKIYINDFFLEVCWSKYAFGL